MTDNNTIQILFMVKREIAQNDARHSLLPYGSFTCLRSFIRLYVSHQVSVPWSALNMRLS